MFSIEEFRSEVNKHNVLHGNRYVVMLPLEFGQNATRTDLRSVDLDMLIDDMGSKSYGNAKTLALRAESVTLPGMSFTSADGLPPRFGYGAMEGIPYNTTFDPVTIQFAMDGAGLTYKYFYEWTNKIVNYRARGQQANARNSDGKVPYEVAYKDDFCAANIEIIVYEPNHDPQSPNQYVMKFKMYRAYPKSLPPINLAWAAQNEYVKFPITFDYTDFDIEFPNSH
jgi:hypothetical protein